jgi:hypothetical protein
MRYAELKLSIALLPMLNHTLVQSTSRERPQVTTPVSRVIIHNGIRFMIYCLCVCVFMQECGSLVVVTNTT